jgi:hypothetical protein
MPSDARVIEYQPDLDGAPDITGAKQDTRFRSGVSGNPMGRPRGSRSKLGEQFLEDLHQAWQEHGKQALKTCATREPTQFAKIVANVLPRQVVETAFTVNASMDIKDAEDARSFLQAFRLVQPDTSPLIEAEPAEGASHTDAWRANDD